MGEKSSESGQDMKIMKIRTADQWIFLDVKFR